MLALLKLLSRDTSLVACVEAVLTFFVLLLDISRKLMDQRLAVSV
jgi:hypothetical protein